MDMKKAMRNLDTKGFCQIGFVVKDVKKTAREFANLFGMPVPRCFLSDPIETGHTKYKGKPSKARAWLAFFAFGNTTSELIQPVGGPSTWKDHLDKHGEGVHHFGFHVKDVGAHLAFLKSKKIPLIQRGDYTGGCYNYMDSEKKVKIILELLGSE
jgi:methylmalonyl-CoA/ethylmalonyl-CoA epimerase